jgi:hypothetical protein
LMSWMASPRDPMMGSIDILEKIRMMIVSIWLGSIGIIWLIKINKLGIWKNLGEGLSK